MRHNYRVMMDLRDRIRMRLLEIRKSARRASIDGGLTPDAIRNVLRSKSRNPRRDTLQGIAQGLEWSLEELLELPSTGNVGHIHTPIQQVPLVSWVRAGELSESTDPYAVGDAEDHIAVANNRNTLIALRVVGTSMNRIAPEDSIIIVDFGDKSLSSGRYYVLKYDGKATFKRYRAEPFRLEPDSTDSHETIFIDREVEIVGRVVQVITNLP